MPDDVYYRRIVMDGSQLRGFRADAMGWFALHDGPFRSAEQMFSESDLRRRLPVRAKKAADKIGVQTVQDFLNLTCQELLMQNNIGEMTLIRARQVARAFGYTPAF